MNRRPTIGVLIDAVHESYQSGIWKGIAEQADRLGFHLKTYVGTSQDGVDHFEAHYPFAVDIAAGDNLSGLILFSGSITEHHGRAFVSALCDRFGSMPMVCVSEPVPGIPCVLVENGPGMEAMVDHFVEVHNLSRIAFVRGPAGHLEAEERFLAYRRALARNNRAYDPALVFDGGFLARDGAAAVRRLCDAGTSFDGVLCVNDDTAFGVLEELRRRGRHVPGEVAVAGFDDVLTASVVQPALSTVRQPLHRMGAAAVDHLAAALTGADAGDVVQLPTEPVFRRSCGCFAGHILDARGPAAPTEATGTAQIAAAITAHALALMDTTADSFIGEAAVRELMSDFIDSLVMDVHRPAIRNIFLNELDMLLFRLEGAGDSAAVLSVVLRDLLGAVTVLFRDVARVAEANNLLRQGQALVADYRGARQRVTDLRDRQRAHRVSVTGQRIISASHRRGIADAMAAHLPALGIDRWHIDLCDQPVATDSWTALPPMVTAARSDGGDERDRPFHDICLPLVCGGVFLGIARLSHCADLSPFAYETLRQHISVAFAAAES